MKRILVGCFALSCRAPTSVAPVSAEGSYWALIRTLVVDSVNAGGTAHSSLFVASDVGTDSLLQLAGVARAPRQGLRCPDSTELDGTRSSGALGYVVKAAISGSGDIRKVSITKDCAFVFRGQGRAFYESTDFEIRRDGRSWRVVRSVRQAIS